MAVNQLTYSGFLLRLLFALLLVLATYNPSGYSYVDWLIQTGTSALVYKVLSGLLLAIGWVIYLRATKNSLGPVGVALAAALFGCIIWLLIEWGLFSTSDVQVMAWAIEIIIALVLAIGMSWSHIRRRLSGQVDTDDVEN